MRYLISKLTPEDIKKLKRLNNAVLLLKADMEPPRELWLDFDDSVITVFGTQEGSKVGYNPGITAEGHIKSRSALFPKPGNC